MSEPKRFRAPVVIYDAAGTIKAEFDRQFLFKLDEHIPFRIFVAALCSQGLKMEFDDSLGHFTIVASSPKQQGELARVVDSCAGQWPRYDRRDNEDRVSIDWNGIQTRTHE